MTSHSPPRTPPRHLLLLGAAQAEHVLAGDHAAVDEDGLETLVARVDHGVEHLLAHEVDLLVPVQPQHAGGVAAVDGGEGGRLQLADVSLHVVLGDTRLARHHLHLLCLEIYKLCFTKMFL